MFNDFKIRFGEDGLERCARVGFPPSGPYWQSLGSGSLVWPCFWRFQIFRKIRFGEDGLERCARSGFPPLGSYWQSLSSGSLVWCRFWRFQISGKSGPGLPPPLHVGVLLSPTVSLLANRPLYPSGVRVHCTV